jgi:16S rRNA (cytosine967-C5)-methyltransferase
MHYKVNDSLLRTCVKAWRQIIQFNYPADSSLSKFFRDNRGLGIHERGLIAETIYTILRNYYKLTNLIDEQQTISLIAYTWRYLLKLEKGELSKITMVNWGQIIEFGELDPKIIELPSWIIERLSVRYSATQIQQLAQAMSENAPLTLRVNSLKTNRENMLTEFINLGQKAVATRYSPYGISLTNKLSLVNNQYFNDGYFEVQDEASQLAGLLLDPKRGEMVVDFCAGSGGKSLLFGMLMRNSGRIYAFDVNQRRLANLTPRLARSGLSNITPQLIAHENDSKIKRLIGKIDKVFVDAPCLGLGTLRRNPDLKFRQNEQSLAEITLKQQSILQSASRLLKVGGKLVYATCSILAEENQQIIQNFLMNNHDFVLEPISANLLIEGLDLADENFLELSPVTHNSDGFFACVLRKVKMN